MPAYRLMVELSEPELGTPPGPAAADPAAVALEPRDGKLDMAEADEAALGMAEADEAALGMAEVDEVALDPDDEELELQADSVTTATQAIAVATLVLIAVIPVPFPRLLPWSPNVTRLCGTVGRVRRRPIGRRR